MQLSKLEEFAYEKLKKNGLVLFRIRELCILLNIDKMKAYNLIKALKKKGAIKKIGKGFFSLKDANEFAVGTSLNYPSYLSFWSALNYYGWSDSTPSKIFLATTKYSKEINNFKYVVISKKGFFGYIKIGEIIIAEKEKAIVDSLLFPKYSGGMKEIIGCLNMALKSLDKDKLIEYALKMGKKAIVRRLGFSLEEAGYKKVDKLRKHLGRGYELLDPSLKRKNNLNKRWLLDINW